MKMVYLEYSVSSEDVTQSSVIRTHLTKRLVLKNISFQTTGTSECSDFCGHVLVLGNVSSWTHRQRPSSKEQ